MRGDPACDELIRAGIHDGFAGSEKKARQQEKQKRLPQARGHGGSERSENAPPDDSAGEDATRPPVVGEPACRSLKERIPEQKNSGEQAELNVAEMIVGSEPRSGDG